MAKTGWNIANLRDEKGNLRSFLVYYRKGKIIHKRLITSDMKKQLTPMKVEELILDEKKASEEYSQMGLTEISKEEKDHKQLFSEYKKEVLKDG